MGRSADGTERAGPTRSARRSSAGYSPITRKMDQSRRFNGSNCEKGIELVNQLNPQQVYVYAMGLEPWLSYLVAAHYTEQSRPIIESDRLVASCKHRGIVAERLFGRKEILL